NRRPIAVPVRVRARLADDGVQLPKAHQPGLRGRRAQNQGSPAHAPACLRIPPSERWPGYAVAAALPRPQEHPAHSEIHRADSDTIQGVVEGLRERTREKGFPNNSRRAVPCNRGSDTAHAGEGAILGPRRRICRGVSWPRILPRIRSASVYLVNFSRLRRLARSWWSTCARSPRWTKKRAVMMKKLLLTSIAVNRSAVENHVHRPPRLGSRRSLNLRIGIIQVQPRVRRRR